MMAAMPDSASTARQRVTQILRCWHNATASDLSEGLDWYAQAQQLAQALAAASPFTIEQTAGVIAALSPRNPWPTNRSGAVALVTAASTGQQQPVVAGLPGNRDKAWAILSARHATVDGVLDILDPRGGAPKVRSFYLNILGDENEVTVDVWAARAAGVDLPPNRSVGLKLYRELRAAYRDAACVLGISPRDLQAAVWVYARRVGLSKSRILARDANAHITITLLKHGEGC